MARSICSRSPLRLTAGLVISKNGLALPSKRPLLGLFRSRGADSELIHTRPLQRLDEAFQVDGRWLYTFGHRKSSLKTSWRRQAAPAETGVLASEVTTCLLSRANP